MTSLSEEYMLKRSDKYIGKFRLETTEFHNKGAGHMILPEEYMRVYLTKQGYKVLYTTRLRKLDFKNLLTGFKLDYLFRWGLDGEPETNSEYKITFSDIPYVHIMRMKLQVGANAL